MILSPSTSDPSVYFTQEMKFAGEEPEDEAHQQTDTGSLSSVSTLTPENGGIRFDWQEETED